MKASQGGWLNPLHRRGSLARPLFRRLARGWARRSSPASCSRSGAECRRARRIIEGLADGISSVAKLWGGVMTDRVVRRKPLASIGYLIMAVSIAAIGLCSQAANLGVPGRRVGRPRGRSAPRDFLIAAAVRRSPGKRSGWAGGRRARGGARSAAGADPAPLWGRPRGKSWPDRCSRGSSFLAVRDPRERATAAPGRSPPPDFAPASRGQASVPPLHGRRLAVRLRRFLAHAADPLRYSARLRHVVLARGRNTRDRALRPAQRRERRCPRSPWARSQTRVGARVVIVTGYLFAAATLRALPCFRPLRPTS